MFSILAISINPIVAIVKNELKCDFNIYGAKAPGIQVLAQMNAARAFDEKSNNF